jgi:hypothetical protein
MKKKLILLLTVFLFSFQSYAQYIKFDYDDAGNRLNRYPSTTPRIEKDNDNDNDNLSEDLNLERNDLTEKNILSSEDKEKSLEGVLSYNLYPNPTQSFITLKVPVVLSGQKIIVMDLAGRTVKTAKIEQQETLLDLRELRQSIYYVYLLEDNKVTRHWKVIKQGQSFH